MSRIHEIAKQYNVSSKRIIEILVEMGITVKSHMSGIEESVVPLLQEKLLGEKTEKKDASKVEKSVVKDKTVVDIEKEVEKKTKQESLEKKDVIKEADEEEKDKMLVDKREDQMTEVPKEDVVQDLPKFKVALPVSVLYFSELIKKPLNDVVLELMKLGEMLSAHDIISDKDIVSLVAHEMGVEVQFVETEADLKDDIEEKPIEIQVENPYKHILEEDETHLKIEERAPVVTLMGHVDHGKTSILDRIRSTRVVDREAGGITQHIGAYDISHQDSKIVFIDTPGHAAFTQMRAMGAKVTDIVILVVAADDGMKNQTFEAVDHAKAADVPIIVAINKIDREGANPDKIKKQLNEKGLVCEEWGGDIIVCELSAKTGEGLDHLLDMILLQAEIMELSVPMTGRAHGVILESTLSAGRGPTCTVLLKKGALEVGNYFVVGSSYGKVRAMFDVSQKSLKSINPNIPAEILGFSSVPQVGAKFISIESDKLSREMSVYNKQSLKDSDDQFMKADMHDVYAQIDAMSKKQIKIVLKADTRGSIEALINSLEALSQEDVGIRFLVASVGEVTDNDVTLAKASDAIIVAFQVKIGAQAKEIARKQGVQIRTYRVIYEVIEEIRLLLRGEIEPSYEEKIIGHAKVQQVFSISKYGKIAGCMVTDGIISRKAGVRVIRDDFEIFKGNLASLKRFKDEVKEVREGFECGILIDGFNDVEENDNLEFVQLEKVEHGV